MFASACRGSCCHTTNVQVKNYRANASRALESGCWDRFRLGTIRLCYRYSYNAGWSALRIAEFANRLGYLIITVLTDLKNRQRSGTETNKMVVPPEFHYARSLYWW
jgi:hypothetical protein